MVNKTYVYYADSKDINIDDFVGNLPQNRIEKLNKLSLIDDKKLSVGVYLLLEKALSKFNIKLNDFPLVYNEDGKPYLSNNNTFISLSHSGNFVAVAISDFEVGIDIQQIKDVNVLINKIAYNEADENYYKIRKNEHTSLEIWTIKEAYSKAKGLGLKLPLKQIKIDYKKMKVEDFSINLKTIKNYKLAVCEKFDDVVFEEMVL